MQDLYNKLRSHLDDGLPAALEDLDARWRKADKEQDLRAQVGCRFLSDALRGVIEAMGHRFPADLVRLGFCDLGQSSPAAIRASSGVLSQGFAQGFAQGGHTV